MGCDLPRVHATGAGNNPGLGADRSGPVFDDAKQCSPFRRRLLCRLRRSHSTPRRGTEQSSPLRPQRPTFMLRGECRRAVHERFVERFDCFVASTAVPIATGWNDTCRVGISPAERVCLCTAHRDARALRGRHRSQDIAPGATPWVGEWLARACGSCRRFAGLRPVAGKMPALPGRRPKRTFTATETLPGLIPPGRPRSRTGP